VFDQWSEAVPESYEVARAVHGDLGVSLPRFRDRIEAIAARCLTSAEPDADLGSFLSALHTNDLYLACACADGLDEGWQRFHFLYRKYLLDLGRSLTGGSPENEEIGQTIWIDLFLPDRSGNSRIASYDGRSSMATWLRVVVTNRVINERQRKDHHSGDLDSIPEPADPAALRCVEDRLGRDRYHSMIIDTFKHAFSTLSKRERLILLLRFDHGVQLGDIAQLLQVHQSTITRQIDRAVARLREHVTASLASQYRLGQPAIEECLGVARETFTSSVSILGLIEERAVDAAKQLYSSVQGRSGT
jgi:RNA polymerase sigma-70 factor (ECF subfamily)